MSSLQTVRIPLAVEVSHLDWWQVKHQQTPQDFLLSLNISQVILDTRPIYNCAGNPQQFSHRKKPKLPVIFIRF